RIVERTCTLDDRISITTLLCGTVGPGLSKNQARLRHKDNCEKNKNYRHYRGIVIALVSAFAGTPNPVLDHPCYVYSTCYTAGFSPVPRPARAAPSGRRSRLWKSGP